MQVCAAESVCVCVRAQCVWALVCAWCVCTRALPLHPVWGAGAWDPLASPPMSFLSLCPQHLWVFAVYFLWFSPPHPTSLTGQFIERHWVGWGGVGMVRRLFSFLCVYDVI